MYGRINNSNENKRMLMRLYIFVYYTKINTM